VKTKHTYAIFCLIALSCGIGAGAVATALYSNSPSSHAGTVWLVAIPSLFLIAIGLALGFVINVLVERVEQFKTRDLLTGLYNRRTFLEFLGHEIVRSDRHRYRFAVLIADMDNFKAISDMYGHDAGDRCLRQFSRLFTASIRKGDIAARYGGDTFAAILPVCDETQTSIVAKRFLESLRSRPLELSDGITIPVTASIGVAVYPDHARDEQSLLLVAHSMVQQAKLAGKDCVKRPSDDMDIETMKNARGSYLFIMDAIRKKQFVPYFQPIVSTKNNSLLAYEVLTRIITPERVITAGEFIEAAEDIGAIGRIDYQLMEKAFVEMKRSGFEGMFFFNLSPKALVLPEFMPTLKTLMREHAINPAQLVFEITERNTVRNLSLIERIVAELKQEGFKFAIDDFGKGYSSFEYIKLFRVDYLKIDGDFIRNMGSASGIEDVIVNNIVSLATLLGITTIAEFVESESVLNRVQSAGIDYAQGYHIMHPRHDIGTPPGRRPAA